MYKELINEEVTVLVATKGDVVLEYKGVLTKETDNEIEISNASVGTMLLSLQRSMFGSNMTQYMSDANTAIINKKYIISCIK